MKIGRHIGDAARRLPGIVGIVDRLRFAARTGRRVRRQRRGGGPGRRYANWVRLVDTPSPGEIARFRGRAAALQPQPRISLLLVAESPDPVLLERAISAIRSQAYEAWEVCVCDPAAADAAAVVRRHAEAEPRVRVVPAGHVVTGAAVRNHLLAAATGDLVAVVHAADVLPPHALVCIAEAFLAHPAAGLVYADEDRIDERGTRHDPWFKCDCNRELLLAHDAISRPAFYARPLLRDLGGWRDGFAGAEDHDLALRAVFTVGAERVRHIPRILCHRGPSGTGAAVASSRMAVVDLLRGRGSDAVVEAAPDAPACNRIRHPLPPVPPLVSIIICTRDHASLLRAAVDSITARTTYPRYELLIVDNGSVEPGAVALLAELATRPHVRVLRDDSPFNYPRLNNRAAAVARGEVLCLLNDDVEVLTPGWLEELVSFAVQPDIGAVGARLWYPDGTLQHGGVIMGIRGCAGHAHPGLERGAPGYFGRAVLQQELSAVTAACLAVRADVFAAVSGLDERLGVAFNDVDFCLRARQAGFRTVWTPFAELVHHESASRLPDDTPVRRARAAREIELLRERWGAAVLHDPFYHPELSHAAADFSVGPTSGGRSAGIVTAGSDPAPTACDARRSVWLWSALLAAAVVMPAVERIRPTSRDVAAGARHDLPPTSPSPGDDATGVPHEQGRSPVADAHPPVRIDPAEPLRVGSGERPWLWPRLGVAFLVSWAGIGMLGTLGIMALAKLPARARRPACLAAMGCLIAVPRLVALGQPLLDWHSFRQTQTALTAFWFARDGVTLPGYPLPVLGRPWTAPFEFPLFQMLAAGVHRLGVPLDPACRGVALLAFCLAVVTLGRTLLKHGSPRFVVAALGIFALTTPFALVWSKASLIEFTAVLGGVVAVGLACDGGARGLSGGRWLLLAAVGTVAALTKITTFVVYWPACALLAADRVWSLLRQGAGRGRLLVETTAWACALAVPLFVGQVWIAATDEVKSASAVTARLTSGSLRGWNHGTVIQRLNYRNWRVIGHRIRDDVLPYVWPLAISGAVALRRLPRRLALAGAGMLAGAGVAVAGFFNLYVVHDYYLSAIALPLWLAAAVGLWSVASRLGRVGGRGLVLPASMLLMIIATARSPMVRSAYADLTGDDVLGFCRELRRVVPTDAELVVVGEDWNPRIPYYAARRALMAWKNIPDALIVDYAARHAVHDLVVRRDALATALRLFPDSEPVMQFGGFELRRIGPAGRGGEAVPHAPDDSRRLGAAWPP